jgi:cytosine/adenosine deaminase-related metal-dependent hydrolase
MLVQYYTALLVDNREMRDGIKAYERTGITTDSSGINSNRPLFSHMGYATKIITANRLHILRDHH